MLVGILALQGDFFEHANTIELLNINYKLIKKDADLMNIDCLILPGGESTAMNIIQKDNKLFMHLKELINTGIPALGTCAGAILLSSEVLNSDIDSLNVLDVTIERNAYGRQNESFEANVSIDSLPKEKYCFIRAPKFNNLGRDVEIIAKYNNEPVGVRQNNIVGFTFHPELTPSPNYLNWLSFFLKGSS